YSIGGTNSKLEMLGGGALNLDNGAQVNVTSSGLLSLSGNLAIGSGASGTLAADGAGANVTQSGGGTLTVGNFITGTAALNIGTTTSGGTLTTGTGLLTISGTGTVNIGSGANTGTLNANGDILIDGGLLQRTAASAFNLAAGKTMTIQNGGRASITGDYTTAASTGYGIGGVNSKLETLGGGALGVDNGAVVQVGASGLLSLSGHLGISNGSNCRSAADGTGANIPQSGAGTLIVGHATMGTAALNIGATTSGGTLTTGTGLLTINTTGTVNIGSGANTGTLNANGDMLIDG